jgi:hypothetical protein
LTDVCGTLLVVKLVVSLQVIKGRGDAWKRMSTVKACLASKYSTWQLSTEHLSIASVI